MSVRTTVSASFCRNQAQLLQVSDFLLSTATSFVVWIETGLAISMSSRLARHSLITTLVVLILLNIILSMNFPCVLGCNNSYGTKPGLTRHQNNCAVYRTSQALKIERRRATQRLLDDPATSPAGIVPGPSTRTTTARLTDARSNRARHLNSTSVI